MTHQGAASIIDWGRKRIPPSGEILSLYATIVFLIYGWASLAFFWKVPSWLNFLTLAEITAILSYVFLSCWLESTFILFIFLIAALLLPSRLLFDKFVVRGNVIIILLTFWMILLAFVQLSNTSELISFGLVILLTIGLALLIAERIPIVERLLIFLSDRLIVFLYLWLPLSLLGAVVALFRLF